MARPRLLALALVLAIATTAACTNDGGDDGGFGRAPTTEGTDETTTTADPDDEDAGTTTTEADVDDVDVTTTVDDEPAADSADRYANALATALSRNDPDNWRFASEDAACIAPEWIAIIDHTTLADDGAVADDLVMTSFDLGPYVDTDQGRQMVDVLIECGVDPVDYVIQVWDEQDFADPELGECVLEQGGPELLTDWLATGFAGDLATLSEDDMLYLGIEDAVAGC